jgi:hypothetical protein
LAVDPTESKSLPSIRLAAQYSRIRSMAFCRYKFIE